MEQKKKRVLVSFSEDLWSIIEDNLGGKMGDRDSEIVRTIVVSYLSEKGLLTREEVEK
ncbi:MAG: CopG family transcriptional regulator [Candidatus Hydrothermarchaeales archaeon]